MKTYRIEIIMDATGVADFIDAVLALDADDLLEHIEEVKE